jgi:hypothetical protein
VTIITFPNFDIDSSVNEVGLTVGLTVGFTVGLMAGLLTTVFVFLSVLELTRGFLYLVLHRFNLGAVSTVQVDSCFLTTKVAICRALE